MALSAPSFLTLPFELRYQIYNIVLDKRISCQPEFYLSISVVCRQIRAEVLPVLLLDARTFRSLSHFSKWASQGSPDVLKHVQNISLNVFLDSLSSMKISRPTYPAIEIDAKPNTAEWWEAEYAGRFETPGPPPAQSFSFRRAAKTGFSKAIRFRSKAEIKPSPIALTWNALSLIGDLKKLWILLNDRTSAEHPEYDIEQQIILEMISASCPKIQEFTGFSNLLPLDYLRNFSDLRLLRFSGYSKSTPEETLDIIRGFKYLSSIIIFRYPEYYDRDHGIVTSELPRHLSFTPDVLSKVLPLKRFEISHMTSRVPSEHVTAGTLDALKPHIQSLRTLSIHSDFPVYKDFVEELLSFVAASNLTKLYLQLTIPKKLESLLKNDTVFPKDTSCRERKFSESSLSIANWHFVSLSVKASL